jgi:hypothetical protein
MKESRKEHKKNKLFPVKAAKADFPQNAASREKLLAKANRPCDSLSCKIREKIVCAPISPNRRESYFYLNRIARQLSFCQL